jgi:hypothetical protein
MYLQKRCARVVWVLAWMVERRFLFLAGVIERSRWVLARTCKGWCWW